MCSRHSALTDQMERSALLNVSREVVCLFVCFLAVYNYSSKSPTLSSWVPSNKKLGNSFSFVNRDTPGGPNRGGPRIHNGATHV